MAAPRADIAQIYKGQDGLFYWRIRSAGNNEVIAQGEGYENKGDLEAMLKNHFPHVTVVDLDAFAEP